MGVLIRYEGFRWLWIGQLLSQLGNAVFLIMGLWEIQLRSPFLLSIAGLAMVVPSMLAVGGGVVVDRRDPRWLMLVTDAARGLAVALGIAALTIPGSLVVVVIALLGINSLGAALFGPAEGVLVPRLVADKDLPAANGVYSLTSQLASAVGSAVGGAAVVAIGVRVVFGLDMGSFWLSALAIALMMRTVAARPRALAHGRADGSGGLLPQLRTGWQALQGLPAILTLMPLILLANFAYMAAFTMLPFWIRHQLHATALWYGLVDAGWAGGLVLGSLLAGSLSRRPIRVSTALMFGAQGLLVGLFTVAATPVLAAAVLFGSGIANGIANALLLTLIQRLVPESVRGRAFGLLMTLTALANPLGTLAAGVLLHVLPLWWAWTLSAVTGIALAVGVYATVPADVAAAGNVRTTSL